MDSSGFIVPPPNLIPPREDTGTETRRAPTRGGELPPFRPPVAASAPVPPEADVLRWQLVLPSGRVVELTETVLLGRNPVRFGPWGEAQLIAVDDPAASVSKTHAAFQVVADIVRVTDAHSTNGVSITAPDGVATTIAAGTPIEVVNGSTVHLGRFAVRVQRG